MLEPLTEREQEILRLLSQGMTNKDIAATLFLAQGTVKAHNHNIFSKLGVSNRTQALRRAQELGLVDTEQSSAAAQSIPDQDHHALTHLSPFVGRQTELDNLSVLLSDERVRLVTILGAGGTGKTRFAMETVRQQRELFPDGAALVMLARIADAQDLATAIVDALGIRTQANISPEDALLAQLHHRQILLLLDNFEHLLQGTDLVTRILQASPGSKVLVTSRERLNLSNEMLFVLSGLEYGRGQDQADPMTYSAVQLLVQRARLINPSFEFGHGDWPQVQRICQLTDGMPLALILATAWLEMLTLEEIADELTQSIDILEGQFRDMPARQRSMRVTITASWQRLNARQQAIFAALSVFRAGFTREAAARVADANLMDLQQLTNRSFVTAHEGRFEIHELLRQYGEQQLQAFGQADTVRATHSAYYLDFLAGRNEDVQGIRQHQALDEIQVDFENIHAAWLWAADRQDFAGIGRAMECLTNFSSMRSFLIRAADLFSYAIEAMTAAGSVATQPVLDFLTVLHQQNIDRRSLPANPELLYPILERSQARNDLHQTAYCLWVIGNVALLNGDRVLHDRNYEECLRIWQSLGSDFYVGHILAGIDGDDMSPASQAIALEHLHDSVVIRRRIGDLYNLSFSLLMIGMRLMYVGQLDEAEPYFDEALHLQEPADRAVDFAGHASMKGTLAFWRGDLDEATRYAQLGLEFTQEMNFYGDKSACQAVLSYVYCMAEDYAAAYELCQRASEDELFNVTIVMVQWGLAMACIGLEDHAAAWTALAHCLDTAYNKLHSSAFQQVCLPLGAALLATVGQPKAATELLGAVDTLPDTLIAWTRHWPVLATLRQDLESNLGRKSFEAALLQGAAATLDSLVRRLLQTADQA